MLLPFWNIHAVHRADTGWVLGKVTSPGLLLVPVAVPGRRSSESLQCRSQNALKEQCDVVRVGLALHVALMPLALSAVLQCQQQQPEACACRCTSSTATCCMLHLGMMQWLVKPLLPLPPNICDRHLSLYDCQLVALFNRTAVLCRSSFTGRRPWPLQENPVLTLHGLCSSNICTQLAHDTHTATKHSQCALHHGRLCVGWPLTM